MSFKSIYELVQDHAPVALAGAIEQHGIYGWDRFDRYGYFTKGSREAEQILLILAKEHAWQHNPEPKQGEIESPIERLDPTADWDHPALVFGWPEESLPQFSVPTDTVPSPRQQQRPGSVTKRENSILLLLAFLAAKLGIDVREMGATGKLHKLMGEDEFEGLSENTLQKIVERAREVLGNRKKIKREAISGSSKEP